MLLENLNPGKKNSKVTVNGHTYWIGHGGFIANVDGTPVDVPATDAERLLQGRAWKKLSWDPADPKNAARSVIPLPEGAGLGRRPRTVEEMKWEQGIKPKTPDELAPQAITVPTKSGLPTGQEILEKAPRDEEIEKAARQDETRPDLALSEVLAAQDQFEARKSGQANPAPAELPAPPAPPPPLNNVPSGQEMIGSYAIPLEGGEWPDPEEKMPIEYLRRMAQAYEVKFSQRTTKARLVKDVHAAMYPEE